MARTRSRLPWQVSRSAQILTVLPNRLITKKMLSPVDRGKSFFYTSSMILHDGTIRHRRKSLDLPYHAHELTFSCYNRYKLLSKERTRQWLVDAFDRARRQLDLHLWAYVIMPEHVHAIVLPQRSEYRTADILKSLKEGVARRAVNFLRRVNPQWLERLTVRRPSGKVERHFWLPGGGYDRNIINQEALLHAVKYIHANPVRRGLVESPTDWEWSSARWYEGERPVKLEMDATLPMLMR